VTSNNSGTSSTLAVAQTDGHAAGILTGETFDSTGTLTLSYSNGQTTKGGQLALATFTSPDDLAAISSNEFTLAAGGAAQVGVAGAGAFGTVQSGEVESSNVDLSSEFSALVVMQRGFQASSEVISTASDMLSKLFDITQGGG
jgi:flagellar hook protein FlgE